jgi:hypothetical protein
MMKRTITFMLFVLLAFPCIAQSDPYASLTQEQRQVLQPAVDRFVRDVTKQDWKDLWEIQDQTSNMKNELLEGHRDAPDLTRSQYVAAMRSIVDIEFIRVRTLTVREVRADKGNFVLIGCGTATRESWHQTGFVIAGIRLVDGKPKFDLWSMTSDSCSN